MGKKLIGIEISDDQLKLVELTKNRKQNIITKYAIEDIPTGLVLNGVVQNQDEMRSFLKKIKRKAKLGSHRINLSINSPNILLRPLQMPKMDKKLLPRAIEMEITNNIQLPFQEYTYDYALIPERASEPAFDQEDAKQDLLLIIASKDMLETYVDLFQKVKLDVFSIDLAPISFLRLLELERKTKMMQLFVGINLHEHYAEVSIFNDAVLLLSRNIPFNPKHYIGQANHENDSTSPTFNYEAYNVDLVREVERILNFFRYTLHHRDQTLTEIVLAGNLPDDTEPVIEALSSYFQVPTSILVARKMIVHKKINRSYAPRSLSLTIPIGLALKDVRA